MPACQHVILAPAFICLLARLVLLFGACVQPWHLGTARSWISPYAACHHAVFCVPPAPPPPPACGAASQTRVFNLGTVRPIRDLDPVDIDTLVAVKGMVTRAGNIIPDLRCDDIVVSGPFGFTVRVYVRVQSRYAGNFISGLKCTSRCLGPSGFRVILQDNRFGWSGDDHMSRQHHPQPQVQPSVHWTLQG